MLLPAFGAAACGGRPAAQATPAERVVLADSTVVPIEVDRGGRAVVAVLLNGRGPYRFAVETGSPDVMLTSATVAALSLPASGGARFR
ncbi:MAG TPA: hypothetical protein VFZ26_14230, partial [Gemmatimonadales bacterium]